MRKDSLKSNKKRKLSANDVSEESLAQVALPEHIPVKRYYSIGDAARCLDIKPYILRYWEKMFDQLNPDKRSNKRRYYTRDDLLLIYKIRILLYTAGFTIEGAKVRLSGNQPKVKKVKELETAPPQSSIVIAVIHELENLVENLLVEEVAA